MSKHAMQLAPKEPTENMVKTWWEMQGSYAVDGWKAMLSAAPEYKEKQQ